MSRTGRLFLVLAAMLAGGAMRALASPNPQASELILLGQPPVPGVRGAASTDAPSGETIAEMARARGLRVRRLAPLSPSPAAARAFPGGAWVLTYEGGLDPEDAARRLGALPGVAYVGPNHTLTLLSSGITPNDTLFDRQFALVNTRVPEAWETSRGEGILIAIVDSGIDLEHPDLAAQIAINAAEAAGLPGVDDDGNGFVDDIMGYDFTDAPDLPGAGDYLGRDPDPSDDLGHGTEVAGVAAAVTDNQMGIAGVAPHARLLAVRAGLRTSLPLIPGLLQEDDAAAAIVYAVARGAQVINLSWGDGIDAPVIRQAVAFAQAAGALIVAAAGNTPADTPFFPSGYPRVVAAGASTREDERAGFSTFGQDLDFLAPGLGILTTARGGYYTSVGGTSFSAPMTAGVAALVWSAHPTWSADQVAWRLRLSARGAASGWNPERGWGLLDAAAAVAPGDPPPVAQVERIEHRDGGHALLGTISDPQVLEWNLSILPDPAGGRSASPEIVLASDQTAQKITDTLGTFLPFAPDSGWWVSRLRTWVRGYPLLEERTRFMAEPVMSIRNLVVQLQAGAEGWDLAANWDSRDPYQGVLHLEPATGTERVVLEPVATPHHAVFLPGPLPPGSYAVGIRGRRPEDEAEVVLAGTTVLVPEVHRLRGATRGDDLPAGTPMAGTVDWNGNGWPEVLVEEPPAGDLYGVVHHYELNDLDPDLVDLDSSAGVFRGIPVDAADADGDGLPEVLVYRIDGWSVWEPRRAGMFPNHQLYTQRSGIPLGFAATSEGPRLLVMDGPRLQMFRADAQAGFVKIAESAPEAASLVAGPGRADLDGDGRVEWVLARSDGEVVVFEVGPSTLVREGSWMVNPEVDGAVFVGSGASAGRVLTLEGDGGGGSVDAALRRAAVRVRGWRWDGNQAVAEGAIAFTGFSASQDLQWIAEDPAGGVLLRRGNRVDLVRLDAQGLGWGGPVVTADLAAVWGAVLVENLARGPFLWLGNSQEDATRGEARGLAVPEGGPAGALRVVAARPLPGGLALGLEWDDHGCGEGVTLERDGTLRGRSFLATAGRTAVDTTASGEVVTYILRSPSCAASTLTVTAGAIPSVTPRWEGRGLLSLLLSEPLRPGLLPNVWLSRGGTLRLALAVQSAEGGRRLLVSATDAADSVIVEEAWGESGLPLGGAFRSAFSVPVPPLDQGPIVETVLYEEGQGRPSLRVTVGGESEALAACASAFRLEPPGVDLTAHREGGAWVADLPTPLAAGIYTLSILPDCADPDRPGRARSFRVDLGVYPNPVRGGEVLVVENAPSGGRAEILDVTGRVVFSQLLHASSERLQVKDIPPGLYLLRLARPDGRPLDLRRIVFLK